MSSREIALLTAKDHRHVLTDARVMLESLGIDCAGFSAQYKDASGKSNPMLILPKRETLILVSGYSIAMRARIIDRWQELEAKQAAPATLSVMDILHIAMESEKGRLLALEQRDQAIATKAQIGSKREATAMATASAAKKESAALKEQLGFCANFATVTAVQNATGVKFDWLGLRRWCKDHNQTPNDVPDKRYGSVKAWPACAWVNVFGVDLMDLFGEVAL
jgi:hypothetical protein